MSSNGGLKIVIASTREPFSEPRRHDIVEGLEAALRQAGHRVETYRIPFTETDPWWRFPEQIATLRLIGIPDGDRMITVGTASWVLMHPQKVVWFTGHYRPAYDQFGGDGGIPDTARGRAVRDAIRRADDVGLDMARRVCAVSERVAAALASWSSVVAEVVAPPIAVSDGEAREDEGDYLLALGDFDEAGRQALAVDAMRFVKTPVRMIVAGRARPETKPYADELRRTVAACALGHRVEVMDDQHDEDRAALVRRARAIVHVPWRETSGAHAVLEAAAAGKPVVTASDSGAGFDFVGDAANGWIADPVAPALALQFDHVFADPESARTRGAALAERVRQLGIDWPSTIERLLA